MTAEYKVQGDVAVIAMNNPPVNGLGYETRVGITNGLEKANADPAVKAIVLTGAGKAFSGGADIKEFNSPRAMQEPILLSVITAVENSQKPVVAAVHSVAMGGGLELALGAHYRIAAPGAKIALPEVKLGLIPGAGGTVRLPRVLGAETALNMIVKGDPVNSEVLAGLPGQKLFDKMAASPESLLDEAIAFAREVAAKGGELPLVRHLPCKHPQGPAYFQFARNMVRGMAKNFPAPEKCVDAVENATKLKFDDALAKEREIFINLMQTPECKALRHIFAAERAASKIPDVGSDVKPRAVNKVAVIGAGTMGGGISMNFLNAGIPVTIIEMKQENLDRGVATIRKNYENTAKKGRITQDDVEKRMALLTPSMKLEDLADCDLIIEAVFELMEIKKDIFGKLDKIAKPGAILATNTSYLNVDEIAGATSRPESVIGLHFFSPANVMRLLEIVRGEKTAKPVIATAMKLSKTIGKVGVLVGNCFGFVGNRMLAQRQREAQKLILEGAMPWDVDRVLYDFGLPMGPFAMSDLAGLDIGWDPAKTSSSTVREVLCEMDRRGQKTGAGFYDYDENRIAKPSPVTEQVIRDFAAKKGVNQRHIDDQEILERTLYPMVNEGAKILEEGKAIRASDIDIVWINGYGWPVYRGGPMHWADSVGLDKILARMKQFQNEMGDDFKPSALLEKLVAEGKGFKDL